ncbi:MAG TPA: serine hydrolase domain-containing protein [Phycisphaerae bacterium]|nr:serine hydrolase domain-containing protein [Phycisphaerae bacterium]HRY70277.1 serine hydrolase domain-containing protein [Phycisphaerae bacterium]HSA27552.1 serine hydrolase domain-containing protein [Phycisphaerae bacterium]
MDVSAILDRIDAQRKVPGMVAAIIEGHRTIGIGASGVRRRGDAYPVTANDRFHLGSCTKSMTATLCAMLVEEERLSWQSTIGEVFAGLEGKTRPEYRTVTLAQLLTHRGGCPAELQFDGLWGQLWAYEGPPVGARDLLLAKVVAYPPVAPPGTRSIYSNAGFAIAGHMAESVTGRAWEELIRERLFKPLDMQSAGFGAPGTTGSVDEPRGHTSQGNPVEPGPDADNPVAIAPAGRVHCSIGDWAKYISLHLNAQSPPSGLLQPTSLSRLHTPPEGSIGPDMYAMGWVVTDRPWGGGAVLTHAGSNTMWFAVTWIAPRRGFAVLAACNQGGEVAGKTCDEAAWAIIQAYQGVSGAG